jgi:hypothetical protein
MKLYHHGSGVFYDIRPENCYDVPKAKVRRHRRLSAILPRVVETPPHGSITTREPHRCIRADENLGPVLR